MNANVYTERYMEAKSDVLKAELQDLIDDQVYNDFVTAIVNEKSLEKDYPSDEEDEDFIPNACTSNDPTKRKEAGDALKHGESYSETSALVGKEGCEIKSSFKTSEVDPEELSMLKDNVPVAVPKESLKATQDRFPPYWRLKHAFRNIGENDGYKSEEDSDYSPNNEDDESSVGDIEERSTSGSSEEELDQDELDLEAKMLQEMHDITQDVQGLSEMVDEMSVVTNQSDAATNQFADEDMREDNDNETGFSPVNFVEAIIQFDDSDYKEEDDSDYEPSIKGEAS